MIRITYFALTICFFFFNSSVILGQVTSDGDTTVYLKSGSRLLTKNILSAIDGLTATDLDYDYTIFYKIALNANGKVDSITMLNQTSNIFTQRIIEGLKKCNAEWVNKTGKNQIVVIPILLAKVDDFSQKSGSVPYQNHFLPNTNLIKSYLVNPIVIYLFPPFK